MAILASIFCKPRRSKKTLEATVASSSRKTHQPRPPKYSNHSQNSFDDCCLDALDGLLYFSFFISNCGRFLVGALLFSSFSTIFLWSPSVCTLHATRWSPTFSNTILLIAKASTALFLRLPSLLPICDFGQKKQRFSKRPLLPPFLCPSTRPTIRDAQTQPTQPHSPLNCLRCRLEASSHRPIWVSVQDDLSRLRQSHSPPSRSSERRTATAR